MKKTLLVTLDFYPNVGGIATYWRGLGVRMPPDSWVVLAPSVKAAEETAAPYLVYRRMLISKWVYPHWLPLLWHILITVRREKIKQIIIGQILPVGTAVWLLSFVIHIPYIVSTHGMDVVLPQQ